MGKDKIKIKICGIRRIEDVEIINQYRPDYIGFVFAPSKRQVSKEEAESLAIKVHPSIKKVGVFVNQPIEFLAELLLNGTVDYLQLHGEEDEIYENSLFHLLRQKGISSPEDRCIMAFRIKEEEDMEKVSLTGCSLLLLDAFSKEAQGGTGETFDWSLIKKIEKPFFLAGGIHAGNVKTAIEQVRPYGIDTSSSLETEGIKDKEKIKAFLEIIREKK